MSELTRQPTADPELLQRLEARRTPTTTSPNGASKARRAKVNAGQRWMRWLHVYTSMIAFVVILFFGVTGLLLNHPGWLGGSEVTTTEVAGTLPSSVMTDEGRVEFLAVSEFLRSEHGVAGEVTNFDQVASEGSINYTGPGYGASARFDVTTLDYDVTIRGEGFVNAMRDIHTGSDTTAAWDLVIDVSAIFLVVVSISGLGIQLLMRKRRGSALAWLGAGAAIAVSLIWLTMV